MAATNPTDLAEVFRAQQKMLWGLCYRLTGVAADADEVVQETFVRAIERPPAIAAADLHRWLARVATHLSLDRLRARRRRRYVGSWLPSPIETPAIASASEGIASRYEQLESVSYAFLLALETLQPKPRAVLILRDVLDYSAADVAAVLDTTEANVRVLHHRARRQIAARPETRPLHALAEPTQLALQALLGCFLRQDVAGMEALLVDSVRTITDSGGEYTALPAPLVGRERVTRFHLETARRRAPISRFELREVNGLAALIIVTAPLRRQMAPHVVLRCEVDSAGRITELHSILAPRKLTAIRFGPSGRETEGRATP
jgi:RNA polymerase sigma-70 factor (ECF subfamily)